MPIIEVNGGYRWGEHGHVYPTRKQAVRQAMAAHANGYKDGLKELYKRTKAWKTEAESEKT